MNVMINLNLDFIILICGTMIQKDAVKMVRVVFLFLCFWSTYLNQDSSSQSSADSRELSLNKLLSAVLEGDGQGRRQHSTIPFHF